MNQTETPVHILTKFNFDMFGPIKKNAEQRPFNDLLQALKTLF